MVRECLDSDHQHLTKQGWLIIGASGDDDDDVDEEDTDNGDGDDNDDNEDDEADDYGDANGAAEDNGDSAAGSYTVSDSCSP